MRSIFHDYAYDSGGQIQNAESKVMIRSDVVNR